MRVTSDLWVAAFMRRVHAQGGFALVARKGAIEAGAIFIRVERDDGLSDLYVPAPQSSYGDEGVSERKWVRAFESRSVPLQRVDEWLAREHSFDPDIWVVVIEDRGGRHFLGDLLCL